MQHIYMNYFSNLQLMKMSNFQYKVIRKICTLPIYTLSAIFSSGNDYLINVIIDNNEEYTFYIKSDNYTFMETSDMINLAESLSEIKTLKIF